MAKYFKSLLNFDDTAQIIYAKIYASRLDADDGYLILELKEGVYLKVTEDEINEFCKFLSLNTPEQRFESISESFCVKITQETKAPKKMAGNQNLVRFKVGF
jgi:hypothetical protein